MFLDRIIPQIYFGTSKHSSSQAKESREGRASWLSFDTLTSGISPGILPIASWIFESLSPNMKLVLCLAIDLMHQRNVDVFLRFIILVDADGMDP
jgi:hypothetical protein